MVHATVVRAHSHTAASPTPHQTQSRTIAAQADAICASLRRLGIDSTLTGTTSNGQDASPDLAVIELDADAVTDPDWLREVTALQQAGVPLIVRHHDVGVASDRFGLAATSSVVHAGTNLRGRRELIVLGYAKVAVLPYTFDVTTEFVPATSRHDVRAELNLDDATILFLQPTRISERKNLAGSIRYLQQLARILPPQRLHFWVTGPVDPTFQTTLNKLLPHVPVATTIHDVGDIASAYAASDAVLYPTTRERFGSVIFEAIQARKPCIVGGFSALGEIEAQGIQLFALDQPSELVKFLAKPTGRLHDVNQRRATLAFGPDVFDAALHATIQTLGIAT